MPGVLWVHNSLGKEVWKTNKKPQQQQQAVHQPAAELIQKTGTKRGCHSAQKTCPQEPISGEKGHPALQISATGAAVPAGKGDLYGVLKFYPLHVLRETKF